MKQSTGDVLNRIDIWHYNLFRKHYNKEVEKEAIKVARDALIEKGLEKKVVDQHMSILSRVTITKLAETYFLNRYYQLEGFANRDNQDQEITTRAQSAFKKLEGFVDAVEKRGGKKSVEKLTEEEIKEAFQKTFRTWKGFVKFREKVIEIESRELYDHMSVLAFGERFLISLYVVKKTLHCIYKKFPD